MSIANKLTYLNTTKQKIKDGINALGGELTNESTFRSYANVLNDLYEAFPKVESEDTDQPITLENTAKGKLKLDYKGNTEQVSTTGKNLLPNNATSQTINGITFTKNDDGTITANGTASASTTLYMGNANSLSEGGTYTISSGLNGENNVRFGISINGTYYNTNSSRTQTFESISSCGQSYYQIDNGKSVSNLILYPMIVKSSTAGDYEPYTNGATPRPDYPQDIHTCSGDNTIEICGKNLLNIKDGTYTVANEITGVVSNGEITLNGTATANRFLNIDLNTNLSLINEEQYIISTNNSVANSNVRFRIDDSGTYDTILTNANATKTITYSSSSVIYGNIIKIRVASGTTLTNYVIKPMLEKGSTPSAYTPYQSQTQLISLGVENLFDKDNANIINCYINVGQSKVLDSTTNKSLYIPIIGGLTYTISKTKSDRFAVGTTATLPANDVSLIDEVDDNNATFLTINTSNTAKYLCVHYWRNSDTKTEQEILNSIEITKGNIPSRVSTTPIELCKIGTYQDYIYKDNGKWYLHKEIGKVVLDGSESWFTESQRYRLDNAISGKTFSTFDVNTPLAYSNYFKWGNGTSSTFVEGAFWYTSNGFNLSMQKDQNPNATTLATFKTWLGTHNTSVYYVLATPTNTEITDTTLISQLENTLYSYTGQTNISQENNDEPFIIKAVALKGIE